jgi:hypothetical protein
VPFTFLNASPNYQVPESAIAQHANITSNEYYRLVGNPEVLRRRIDMHASYPPFALKQDYIVEETSPGETDATFTYRGLPTLDFTVQTPYVGTTYLGRLARPVLTNRHSLRGIASAIIDDAMTTHRLWITLDMFQHKTMMATGYLAPNFRTYQLYTEEIRNYAMYNYGRDAGERLPAELSEELERSSLIRTRTRHQTTITRRETFST